MKTNTWNNNTELIILGTVLGETGHTSMAELFSLMVNQNKIEKLSDEELKQKETDVIKLIDTAKQKKSDATEQLRLLFEAQYTEWMSLSNMKAAIYTSLDNKSPEKEWLKYLSSTFKGIDNIATKINDILYVSANGSVPQREKMNSLAKKALTWLANLLKNDKTKQFTENAISTYLQIVWASLEILIVKNLNDQIIEEIKARKNK